MTESELTAFGEIRLVPYWNVNFTGFFDLLEIYFIRLVPYWNVNLSYLNYSD